MAFLNDIREIERRCNEGGVSLSDLFGWVAQNGFGLDVHLRRPISTDTLDPDEASTLEELKAMFERVNAALAALTADVEKDKTILASALTTIQGFPAVVATAVSQALAQAGVDEGSIAAQVASVQASIAAAVDPLAQAIQANTTGAVATPAPTTDPAATSDPAAPSPAPVADTPAAPATDAPTPAAPDPATPS